jgi:8-oxo-dGTP diphosphatase
MKEDRVAVRASYVVLCRGNEGSEELLLGLRKNTGYQDGCWGLPSGHVMRGEMPAKGAVRELKEEIGVEVSEGELVCFAVGNRLGNNKDGDRVDFYFLAKEWRGEVQNVEDQKCERWEWHALRDMPENLMSFLPEALQRLAKQGLPFYFES